MSKSTGRGRRGWITKNIRSRTRRMIASLEDRGVTHATIAARVGYRRGSSVSLMKHGHITYSREKYESLRALYREAYPNGNGATVIEPETSETQPTPEAQASPAECVAEALADLDQAKLLFNSAERRIRLAQYRTEELAAKIREVGLN